MIEWRKVFFYAVVPALIAGLFAIAPKLYDEITEPKAKLEYSIVKGPALKDSVSFKTIYAINILNNGKRPLTKIQAIINSNNDIIALNVIENLGLSPKLSESDNALIQVENLHPSEEFTISFMVESLDSAPSLDFALRSKEVLGEKRTIGEETSSKLFPGAFLSALAVFIMASYFLSKTSTGSILHEISEKPHILYYIAARLGIKDILISYGVSEGNVTYHRFSDMLLGLAVSETQLKEKCLFGLKCMLLINPIASDSKAHIIRNIKSLEGNSYSASEVELIENNAEKLSNHIILRDKIDNFLDGTASFLTSPNKQGRTGD